MGIQYFNRGGYRLRIHYDTIEDGQNKTSHRLFSNCQYFTIEKVALTPSFTSIIKIMVLSPLWCLFQKKTRDKFKGVNRILIKYARFKYILKARLSRSCLVIFWKHDHNDLIVRPIFVFFVSVFCLFVQSNFVDDIS